MRGEDSCILAIIISYSETPPRAWRRRRFGENSKIIHQKHLHMRGEDNDVFREKIREWETPPRAWRRTNFIQWVPVC